ncbi:MAG TPA: nitrite/sulfite reductase [bacterium]|nr:nitrite/sulfite reductase [bacterium]
MSSTSITPLPDVVRREIDHFSGQVVEYRAGSVPDEQFKPFRLVHGIYGQRQENVQMMRIKVPGGQLSSAQSRRLGEICRDFAPRKLGHVTTRQAVQLHFIPLEQVPAIWERLAEVDLTSREACGNAVRNITCSPVAGLAADEAFDAFPYAEAAFRYFLRRAEFSALPRKFKMAFNGSERDHSQTAINDVGAVARVRIVDGLPQRGFKIRVGGGLGASPQDAWTYSDFVPADEVLPLITAILIHFNEKGERKNRMAARLKFLIRKEGFEAFQAEVERIRGTLPKQIPFELAPAAAEPQGNPAAKAPADGPGDYKIWQKMNTWPQKQAGFHYILVKLTLGDVTEAQWAGLADLTERLGNATLRTSNDQNLLIPFIPSDKLAEAYAGLQALGLADLGPDLIGDVTSCPGADTCNLGLVASRGLGGKLTELLTYQDGQNADLAGTHIKISGCPNSCGQHHIGTFGFFGNVRKVDGKDAPHFQMLIGGGINDQGATFGRVIGRVPARRAPLAVQAFVAKYRAERLEGQSLEAWLRTVEVAEAKKVIEPFTEVVSNDPELFKDNGSEEPFKFEGVGASECA